MIKVVFVMNLAESMGGAERVLRTFLQHADRSRIEPVVVFFGRGSLQRDVTSLGIRTLVIPSARLRQPGRSLANVVRLARILGAERPQLIVNWLTKSQLYGAPAAGLARMSDRVAWWQHDVRGGHWSDRLATALPGRGVVAVSYAAANAQAELWPHRPTFPVHPGIDSPPRSRASELADLRSSLGISADSKVLGIVGRLLPWKGHHRFISALARLREDGHDVHGLVVGGNAYNLAPGYDSFLQRQVKELGLQEACTFTGQVPLASPCMQLMDVFVSATAREPFGLVLLEAMALEVPVVAVDSAGPREIVEHGQTGLLAESDDPQALAAAVGRLLDDSALRLALAAAARARFEEHFTAERMTEEIHERLHDLSAYSR